MNSTVYTFSTELSVLFYILIILSATYLVWKADWTENSNRKVYLILAFLVLAVPACIRYGVGNDQLPYMELSRFFGENYGSSFSNLCAAYGRHNVEYSFIILSFMFYKIPIVIFTIYAALTQFFFLNGIWYFRKEISPSFALFIYLTTFYLRTFNIFRQAIAIAIVFWGIRFIRERKLIPYCICVVAAAFFHDSAIASIVLYPLLCVTRQGHKYKFFVYLKKIVSVVAFVFSNEIFSFALNNFSSIKRHENYYEMETGASSILTLGTLLQVTMFILFIRSRKNEQSDDLFLANLLDNTMIWNILFHFLSFSMGHATRVGLYFTCFLPCALASMHIKGTNVIKSYNTIYDWFLLAYCCYKLMNTLVANMFTSIPYSFWLG